MIRAWVLYRDLATATLHFEERDGEEFAATNPANWGLSSQFEVILVLQHASFLQAWLRGTPQRIN